MPSRAAEPVDKLIAVQFAVVLALIGCRCLGLAERAEGELTAASALFVALAAWHLYAWRRASGTLLDPHGLFLLAATMFNGAQTVLQLLGANEDGMLDGNFDAEQLITVIFYVALGLACMQLGALLGLARARRAPSAPSAPIADADVRRAGWLLLILSAPFCVFVLGDAVQVALASGYLALYQTDAATGVGAGPQVLAAFVVPAALLLLAGSDTPRRSSARAGAVVIFAYAVIQLFLGRRYSAAMPLVAFAWLWHVRVRPIPRSLTLGAGAFAVFVLFPVVAATRLVSGADRLSLGTLVDAFANIDNVFVAIFKEVGGSMGALAHTVALVPSARPFDYGLSYGYAALTLLPNLFWDIHPSIAAGTPSYWLVWAVDPWQAALGGGLGYSFLAEAYLNFGALGIPLVGFAVGFAYARFVHWALADRQPARLATVATVAAFFTFFARAESAVVVRAVVYYGLIPYWGLRWWTARRRSQARALEVAP